MTNHSNRQSINAMEAGAFYTHCKLLRLTTAEAIAELARTTWLDMREDLVFGRRRHTPTIRRLARALVEGLDAEMAQEQARQAAKDADARHWESLAIETQDTIRGAVLAASRGETSNKAARNLAAQHGVTVHAATIDLLGTLAFGGYLEYIRAVHQ